MGLFTGPEAAMHGVRISVLCPGSVDTPILDRGPDTDLPPIPSRAITAREYLTLPRQRPVPAERSARDAVKGIERNRAVIFSPPSVASFWYLHRMSPAAARKAAGLIAGKVHRELVAPRGSDP